MANIGSAAEGAFAIALTLHIIQNDRMPKNQHLELNSNNIKYWMQQIPLSSFENGGTWVQTMYDGKATLSKAGYTAVDETNVVVTPKASNQIPVDFLRVTLEVGLKPEEVRGMYGPNASDLNKLNDIISQMIADSGRYKSYINSFKNKYLTNNKKELISVYIKTIGKEGEQSGGAIKGDVQLEVTIQAYDPITFRPKAAPKKNRFPTMYFSLKASATPPKTISNESPIKALKTLSEAFGVDPFTSPEHNVPIKSLGSFQQFITTANKKRQNWMVDLYGSGLLVKQGKRNFLKTSSSEVNISRLKIFDLLDDQTYPELWRAKSVEDRFWKSFVVKRYVESVFGLIPSGELNPEMSNNVWSALFKAGFGVDPYASRTFLLAYGNRTFQSSSLEYLRAVKEATNSQIYATNTGSSVEFYIGTKKISKAKLYHIRYKNRSVYDGDISESATFDLQNLLKLELKLMPEAGDAFKEKNNWRPGQQLEFNQTSGTLSVAKET